VKKGKLPPEILIKGQQKEQPEETNEDGEKIPQKAKFQFKLLPYAEEDKHLKMTELPKKLKVADAQKTIFLVKKHIHSNTEEPIDNIEVLCKGIIVSDAHTLEWVKRTKWQNNSRVPILMYKRKKHIV